MQNKKFGFNLNILEALWLSQKYLKAATFAWDRDHGAATGSPAKGATRSAGVTDANWKNSDTEADAYGSFPITDGNNSYVMWLCGHFSGTFNTILSGLFAHTATALGTGLTLFGPAATSSDGTRPLYTTPATATDSTACPTNITSAISIASGVAVFFGATGPEATGKAASMTTNPCYSNFLPTQLRTSGAAAGDTATLTLTLQYQEN